MKKIIIILFILNTFGFCRIDGQENISHITSEPYSFISGDATISGTLSYPVTEAMKTVVILVSGTGPQDRDWTFGRAGYKMGQSISDYLNNRGIAVLRYDDRGYGESTGTAEAMLSYDDLAEDIHNAVTSLKMRGDIGMVGLCGHSMGGILAVKEAARYNDVDFIISLAGTFVTGEEILMEQAATLKRWRISDDMTDEEVIANGEKFVRALSDYSRTGESGSIIKEMLTELIRYQINNLPEDIMAENMKEYKDTDDMLLQNVEGAYASYTSPHQTSFILYSAASDLPAVSCPVLVLFGGEDKHVNPAGNIPPLCRALENAKTTDFTLKVFTAVDHGFTTDALYRQQKMPDYVPEFISSWILQRSSPGYNAE